ncbi:MAG: PBP1A family penicillin-binding protein, partial [Actinobacteria bacterium]|nr:PBP1A family penicillin-binding protein [Actinomycetota bacterium]
FILFAVGGAGGAYGLVTSWLQDLPDYEDPRAFEVAQATRIYSADGVLLARLFLENRTVVPKSEISTYLVEATVAVEDERFFEHPGVDPQGILRAFINSFIKGRGLEGASTLTQQYIRNTILVDERTDITFRRIYPCAYLALELEKRKSKEQILELYLNAVYYGEGAYGAQAAARVYFSKDAADLTLAEAALLAGLPQRPGRLSPYDNPDGALERRAHVLERMYVNDYITREEYESAMAEPLNLKRADEPLHGIYSAHYFVAHVRRLLQDDFDQSLVFQGGLTVHTTLDTRLQGYAENAVFSALGQPGDPDAALVSVDPRNGHIRAMVGGRDYATNKFNLATQGSRQPGSAFKTFVLVAAMEDGMPPHRLMDSSSPAVIRTTPPWEVSNSEGRGRGLISIDRATAISVNTVFARLIWDLNERGGKTGAQKVADVSQRMGITTNVPALPSIALGSQNVTPLEMAAAYGTLATNGLAFPPIAITKVEAADGAVVYEAEPESTKAIEPEIAYAATTVLEGVISRGTASRARIGRPAAGKTGTSQNNRDAWFAGYTPQLSTAVWVGHYETELPMNNVRGRRGFGGTLAAPIWADFMRAAHQGLPVMNFDSQPRPDYIWKPEWDSRISVPALAGMNRAQITDAMEEAGLRAAFTEAFNATVPAGQIVSQRPEGGARVRDNTVVNIVISRGPAPRAPTPAPTPPVTQPTPTPPTPPTPPAPPEPPSAPTTPTP